ncbi:MFS transporter, ACS family, tartrate transporter [Enhydrobacter aerosaccus]|uniref:Putative tartrate transporter n=1 Tax=Enhydrobacter aerosaccus TaxID=225324 RepID=A0A1T4T2Z1_9HYPH|nr:MFS transporter [Enhydrobacter aerosaccus]SKA34884.1 MFS transporter, ACS family, tartrate transporter [Enhydrobacter aerosaccus]
MSVSTSTSGRADDGLYRKIGMRLIPFMMVLYLVAFLDRVNIGFAALTMNADVGLSPTIYGWGAGIFFFGYFIFEVPSNVILEKVGARLWIARIMITWGVVSAAMAFISGPWSFFILRFLLGVAEAGFLPGMILYLTYWYPAAERAKFIGLFMAAVPLATVVGAPVSGLIIGINDTLGLKGWQWLFILEGLPSCLLGLAVLRLLPDGPRQADWLTPQERAVLEDRLAQDREAHPVGTHHALWPALIDGRVLLLGLVYFGIVIGLYGIGLWLPQIIKAMGFSNAQVGYITALPYLASALAMMYWGRRSDRTGERVWHVALAAGASALGFVGSIYTGSHVVALCCLGLAAVGIYATLGPFWAMPPLFLRGTAAAGGIALINAVGNLGGFAGPYLVGWIKESTGSYNAGMGVLACGLAAAAILALVLGRFLPSSQRGQAVGQPVSPG